MQILFILALAFGASAQASAERFSAYVRQYQAPEFISSNNAAFDARLKLLDQAPAGARALVATFAFENSATVRQLSRHLCLAAQRGVKVELVVDGRSAGRPGVDDALDKNDNAQLVEDLLQYLANCGATVHVHNLQTSYVEFMGFRLPNIFLDERHEGRELGVFHLRKVLKRLSFLLDRASVLIEDELAKGGVQTDAKPLLRSFRSLILGFVRSAGTPLPPSGKELRYHYENILMDPLWAQLSNEKVQELLPKIEARFHADAVFGPFGEMFRRYNRITHRKLFLVEHNGEGCMILGGRNLGDHYLADSATSFYDGDMLICRHHGAQASATLDGGVASFRELLTDLSDEYIGKRSDNKIFHVKRNPNYGFSSLVFPVALRPAGFRSVKYQGMLELKDRVLPREKTWADALAVRGAVALKAATGWRLLSSSWDPMRDNVKKALIRGIEAEREEVFIETAYAEFDMEVRKAIEAALERGVKVNVITNSFFTSDGPSGMIRLLMSAWNERMIKTYPGLFRLRLTSPRAGQMTHFKFAAFACQGEGTQSYLLGSHNFHPRSGNSDKEHMLAWNEAGGCQRSFVKASALVKSREAFYARLSVKKGVPALESYPTLFHEFAAASVQLEPAKAAGAYALLEMLYEQRDGVWRPFLSARADKLYRLLDNTWLHDLLGRIL